jgi:UDP-N-acetylmuramoyl-tripeptide--D-alanyl-D-alanine ligase
LQLKIIGITGSYGKTSVSYAVSAVLSRKYSLNKTDINLDTNYNLPITILKTKIWNEVLVLEYGVDHLGEMDNHLRLVKPKIGVLTGITPVHADKEHLGSLENIIKEKRKLIDSLSPDGLAIFNYDDEIVRNIGSKYEGRKIFYGTNKFADVWASDIKITTEKTLFKINQKESNSKVGASKDIEIQTGLLGFPAVYSCLAAWIIGKELKLGEDIIKKTLKELKPLRGRLSIEKGPMETILVNDALRANLASTLSGLKSFSQFQGRKIAVLGEMGEIGEEGESVHKEVGKEFAKLKIDVLVGIGPLAKFIIDGARENKMKDSSLYWVNNVAEAAKRLEGILKKNDLLYLKGSLLKHLERVILILNKEKIDCDKISCNRYSSCGTCPNKVLKVK